MKLIKKIAVFILLLFGLMIWSAIVRNITLGAKTFGPLTEPVRAFSRVPSDMKKAYKHYFVAPDYYLKTRPEDSAEINNLTYDVFATYAVKKPEFYEIILENLRDGSVHHQWQVDNQLLLEHFTLNSNDRLFPATLLPNRDIVVSCNEQPGLLRLDSNSQLKWFNSDYIYHHAITFDSIGNIWIPAARHTNGVLVSNKMQTPSNAINYRDDIIVKVDVVTGQTLFSKSLTEIFQENNLEGEINNAIYANDPFHLNDIQPALYSSKYFEKDDVFLSFRHMSSIIQYRPSTNKVIRLIKGNFSFQHDVDILSDSTIGILNNNTFAFQNVNKDFELKPSNESIERIITHSNVLIHNFGQNSFEAVYEDQFIQNEIFTNAEGLYEFLENGDLFFEEQNSGRLWIINADGVVLKTVLKSDLEGYHHLPNWTSIYSNIDF